MNERITRKITRAMMALVLAATVCGYPFVCAKKAEAIAPAVGAAAAAGALAAELGITTEALMTGLAVVTAAGTGIYLLNSSDYSTSAVSLNDWQWRRLWDTDQTSTPSHPDNWDESYRKYKLGNDTPTWDDLSDAQKEQFGSPAGYVQSQLMGVLIQTGMLNEVTGGGYEPTPEPDPEQDPEGHARWQKARNVLTALGVGAGAVALNEAVGWLGSAVGNGIHDLIFGPDALGMELKQIYSLNGQRINFSNAGPFNIYGTNYSQFNWYGYHYTGAWHMWYYGQNLQGYEPVVLVSQRTVSGALKWVANPQFVGMNNRVQSQDWRTYYTSGTSGNNDDILVESLNAQFAGSYVMPDGAVWSNGVFSGGENVENQYPYIADTPAGIVQNVTNNNGWPTFINNYSQPNENGQVPSVTIPATLPSGSTVTYPDFVTLVDESETVPIPDDEPLPLPEPEPEPEPSPGVPEDFQQNMDDSVERIMRNPLDQLFPFCLLADFRDFVFIFLGGRTDTQRLHANSLSTQSDTEIDDLNGVHNLRIDASRSFEGFVVDIPLDPLHDLLDYARTPLTILMTMYLVYESFKFFLFRGGE